MKKVTLFRKFVKSLSARLPFLSSRPKETQIEESKNKDFITLLNGRRVRMIYNANTKRDYFKLASRKGSQLRNGKCNVSEIRHFLWIMAREGEKVDGRELNLTEIEFGRLIDLSAHEEVAKVISKIAFFRN